MTAVLADRGRAAAWRLPVVRWLLAAYPLFVTLEVVVLWTPWRQKLLVGSMAAVTFASPEAGLLALCLLTPLGALLEAITNLPYRLSEAFVLAFLGAWLIRAPADRGGPRLTRAMTMAAWLLGVALAAAVARNAWEARVNPRQIADVGRWLLQAYYVVPDSIGFVDAARLAEVLALVAVTVSMFRQRPALATHIPAALAIGGALAAGTTIVTWTGDGPAALVTRFTRFGYRTAHISDLNAAGSYYALVVCIALGMAVRSRGRWRSGYALLAAANAIGLWFAESKSAAAAAGAAIALGIGWLVTARVRLRTRVLIMVAVLASGVAVSAFRAQRLEQDPTFRGSGFRSQFNATSLRMIAARPLSGVGVGRYFITSELFLSPELSFAYGHENAHNYYLQLAAEMGLPAAALFLIWIVAALAVVARALAGHADGRLTGLAAGVSAFLATCATGHPLLVAESAYPFAIAFAIAFGLADSVQLRARASRSARAVPVAPIVAIAAAIVAAIAADVGRPIEPSALPAVDGFYGWETAADGTHYRWTGQYASLFVPREARRVYIPVRMPDDVRQIAPLGVEVARGGITPQRVFVGASWTIVDVPLDDDTPMPVKRIDLKVDRTWQPAIYIAGSDDMRSVGIEVGDWRRVE